jgi:lipopolysaccharide biosynthesis glycosyltransferase
MIFIEQNLIYFKSLNDNYEVKINYYIIPNIFGSARKWGNTSTVYYKLLIPLIFSEFERIIFLDGDTLIFKDILEMYRLPFNKNYVLGYPFHSPWLVDDLGVYSIYYINGGILIFNIKEIRRTNADIKLLEYTMNNFDKVNFLEQDTINYIFFNKIGLLPLKYGVYLFGNFIEFKKEYLYKFRFKLNLTEMKEAIKDPSIVHFCCCTPKVWNKDTQQEHHFNHICIKYQKHFYYYANKTNYFSDIYNKYMN